MKRLFSLFLALLLLFSLPSCSAELSYTETKEPKPKQTETVSETETKEEPLPALPEQWPEGFCVGYNRQSVAPKVFPIVTYSHFNHIGYSNHDPVQLTCTALCDGTTPVLLFSLDIRGVDTGFVDYSARLIEEATGIPQEHVFINSTHTHSAPDNSHFGEGPAMQAWMQLYFKNLVRAATLALCDLSPAKAFSGTGHSEGVTFVRRYLMADGTYVTNPSSGTAIAHESEADTEMRVLRFEREGKKDVIMVNYQTHYHGSFAKEVSADFIHPFREEMEADLNCHFVYHNGASGNLNFQSAIKGERKYPGLENATHALVEVAQKANESATPIETGPIFTEASHYQSVGNPEVRFYAFGMGEIAFCSAPYEMFDTNGKWIRENSPYRLTFVCAYTNGHMGYCPSALAYPNGAYEVGGTPFREGSGEEFATEIVRLLNECRKDNQ